MSEKAIAAVSLSKVYYRTESGTGNRVPFYALKGINFELEKGEVLGIIGNNGSGKSTLLRVLSGITKPSEGYVEINGSVASILDIGTGFHPDLSGTQNVYMRGQLLGMSKAEIDLVFDEIVEFSGVGEFIDSPVKHYSSGMFLRLAFSIIIHLNANILLLDEVMAVGDAEFRQKCGQKITDLVNSGRTVIMVSHDLRSVMDICTLTALMKDGEIVKLASPLSVVSNSYLAKVAGIEQTTEGQSKPVNVAGWKDEGHGFEIHSFEAVHGNKELMGIDFKSAEEINLRLKFTTKNSNVNFGITVTDFLSNRLMDDSPQYRTSEDSKQLIGTYDANWKIQGNLLNSGRYFVDIYVIDDNYKVIKHLPKALQFTININDSSEDGGVQFRAPIANGLTLDLQKHS